MALVQALTVDDAGLTVKFEKWVKVTSIVNSAFSLYNQASTPSYVSFKPINQFEDYNSISRSLRLNFASHTLPADTYTFKIHGLLDAANVIFDDYETTFTAGDATPSVIKPIPVDVVQLTDFSIRSNAFLTAETIFVSNPDFYIVSTDPADMDLYVPSDYNSGRITVRFSVRPAASVLNSGFFKIQRKKVQRLPARWEDINAKISIDNVEPWVYVDLPSVDDIPVYTTPGHTYFVTGYKYRIIFSKDIGS